MAATTVTTGKRIVYAITRKEDNNKIRKEGAFRKPTFVRYVRYALLSKYSGSTGVS